MMCEVIKLELCAVCGRRRYERTLAGRVVRLIREGSYGSRVLLAWCYPCRRFLKQAAPILVLDEYYNGEQPQPEQPQPEPSPGDLQPGARVRFDDDPQPPKGAA